MIKGISTNSATPAVLATSLIGIGASSSRAVNTSSVLRDQTLIANGQSYAGRVVQISGTNSSGNTFRTQGLLTSPYEVTVAGHVIPGPSSTGRIDSISNGPQSFTNPGITVGANSWFRHPDYITGDKTRPDLGKIILNSPLPFTNIGGFSSFTQNANYTVVSFGAVSYNGTTPVYTGDIRAWEMQNVGLLDPFAAASLYTTLIPTPANEFAISTDSSAIIFDNVTNLPAGIVSYASGSATGALMTNTPVFTSFVPEPISLLFFGAASTVLLQRSRIKSA